MFNNTNQIFLGLVRQGIGHEYVTDSLLAVDWNTIEALAKQHGLLGIMVDGIANTDCPDHTDVLPMTTKLTWIGEVMQGYEQVYAHYTNAIANLAALYNAHGFRMMILKGYACAMNWPKPEHRPCGDIDIWLFGQQKEADSALTASSKFQDSGSKIDNSHHHHSVFNWGSFTVENHYDFVNVYGHRSSCKLEKIFKKLGQDDSHFVEIMDASTGSAAKVYLPSPNLHALFLIRHMVSHFAAAEINLRQVLDWAFFVEKHTKEINWEWLVNVVEQYHMKDFYNCINAICVEDLGFEVSIFPTVQFEPALKDRVLKDIIEPAYTAEEPRELLKRLIYKYKRWQGNAWKQEMCYSESRWSAFWSGVWAKILKPATI